MESIRVRTPAKINLFLRVLGRRPDGYHDLETLFQAIDLWDELVIRESAGETTLSVPGFPALETDDNLVLQAVRWMEEQSGRRISVDICLRKRIPIAGGLGGGSSDAAATLVGLRTLLDLSVSDTDLRHVAAKLGADVPFFLMGGSAVGEGIGERLTPVDVSREYGLILVAPGFPVATATVFKAFSQTLTGEARPGKLRKVLRARPPVAEMLHNDLQPVSERLYPIIREIRTTLEKAGANGALMSGSGATVFGIINTDPEDLERVREKLPGTWRLYPARPTGEGIAID